MSREDILAIYEEGPEAVVALVQTIFSKQAARIVELEERVKSLEDQTSQTAAAHPAAELTGHARRRRMKTETDSGPIPKLDTYALYPRSRPAGYYR